MAEGILLTSDFRILNKGDSEDDGVRVNYPEVYNTYIGCLGGVRKAVELDCVKIYCQEGKLVMELDDW